MAIEKELKLKENIVHRDVNWLSFNERVLQEAENQSTPLYERLKFLAIFSSNLDEYFRVRVSQLRQIKRIDKSLRKRLTFRPKKEVKEILKRVKVQQERFGNVFFDDIIPQLRSHHIHVIDSSEYSAEQKEEASTYYESTIKQHLNPQLVNFKTDKDEFLENDTIYFVIQFKDDNTCGLLNIPVDDCGRFFTFEPLGKTYSITFIDDIIRSKVSELFPNKHVTGIYEVKMSRDAELYLDDEYDGILAEKIYNSLKQRMDGQPTRLLYDAKMPKTLKTAIRKYLGLGKIDMMPGGTYHNFRDFFSFPDPSNNSALHFEPLEPIKHKVLEASKDYFETIKEKDQLLHFPFMSFDYVEKFIEAASEDKHVTQIKISLYRVADESKLTSALLKALDNGKKLTVFIEAKARFDEENNIIWGRKFEDKGAKVIYSYPRIKVHSKILMVERLEDGKKRRYAYIGTGNFNSKTAKIYCDHALFTAHKKVTKELSRVFDVLEGDLIIPRNKHLLISPFTTRRVFEKLIRHEMDLANEGKPASITAKMNSLEDAGMIELLYRASEAGVVIRLLVRGFTCLIPGKKGLSENIYMTSIIDRFLEHGRIYAFGNEGDEVLYFGSADWMTRNLDRRIEVLTPIYDEDLKQEMKDILNIQMRDNVKARIQDAQESNTFVEPRAGEALIRSQYAIYDYLKQKHNHD